MSQAEIQILDKLCNTVFKENIPVYFILDHDGNILQWGGRVSDLNFPTPETKMPIADVVIFMEGILPFHAQNMEFSCIKLPKNICVDALLFKTGQGYGLIIWDSTKKDALLTRTQQEFNELSLMIEHQKNRISQMSPAESNRQELFLEDLFIALNFAVLEMNDQGDFTLIGKAPDWIEHIPQSKRLLSGLSYEDDVFSFLGNFIQETKKRWQNNRQETMKSGLWIEKDHNDQELLFEATALDIHHRKMLIISHDVLSPNQTQSIIQKGRALALHYHDLKRSGQRLKDMHAELETRVKERTKDLEQANLQLAEELAERKRLETETAEVARQLRQSQKLEAIGTLAGGIAHDFNNILAAIIGFTELSLAVAGDDDSLKSRLEKVLHASTRAKDLVRQILMFSHQTDYEKQPLKFKTVINEVLSLLRASFPASIEIKKHLASSGYILADHTQIHQVIMNLCTNAWHAMKEKGGTLQVQLQDEIIKSDQGLDTAELPAGRYLKMTISDTGCGIAPDLLEKIFDPYFTTKDKEKGTGLGLSVVLGIISKSGGAVTVDSKPGTGSTFYTWLPEFFPAALKDKSIEAPIMGNNEHILFLDDEHVQTQMAEGFGQALGYRITTFTDSRKALVYFKENADAFDLVITDMVMPGLQGDRLAEKLLGFKPDLPIIMSSGYSDTIDRLALKQIGVKEFLQKPFSMTEFAKTIHNTLNK